MNTIFSYPYCPLCQFRVTKNYYYTAISGNSTRDEFMKINANKMKLYWIVSEQGPVGRM